LLSNFIYVWLCNILYHIFNYYLVLWWKSLKISFIYKYLKWNLLFWYWIFHNIIYFWVFSLLGNSLCIITELGNFLKNYGNGQIVWGEHVFVCRNRVAPKRFVVKICQQAKSCGGWTIFKENRCGVVRFYMKSCRGVTFFMH